MKNKIWMLALAVSLLSLALVRPVQAQEPTPRIPTDDEVNAIAKQLYCPVCENTPLDVCPTQACAEWRELIRDKLAQGWTEDQIKAYFVEQFGDRVIAAPPARGLNWLVYIIPPIAFLLGVFILVQAFKAWRRPASRPDPAISTPSTPQADEDEYVERLEAELRKLEEQ